MSHIVHSDPLTDPLILDDADDATDQMSVALAFDDTLEFGFKDSRNLRGGQVGYVSLSREDAQRLALYIQELEA